MTTGPGCSSGRRTTSSRSTCPKRRTAAIPTTTRASTLDEWRAQGVVISEDEPALWALEQRYTDPDGDLRTRRGFFARVRVEEYGAGRIRPHERTHPGPKEDRLRLTRATRANLSPIFSLYPDPEGAAEEALGRATEREPFATASDQDGTENRLWRIGEPELIAEIQGAVADAELLIADGHHRYETARIYADEVGGEGEHRYVLMLLVSLSDPGLTVFPTHRLLNNLKDPADAGVPGRRAQARLRHRADRGRGARAAAAHADGKVAFGYMDSHFKQPFRLTLKDQSIADDALPGMPEPYRRLDTAVLEALVLRGALDMTEDDISHLNGLGYSRSFEEARHGVESGDVGRRLLHARHPGRPGPRGGGDGRVDAAQVHLLLSQGPDGPGVQSPRVKIYTRKGDDGTTGLWYGGRVQKFDGRPEAYGSVDEAASALGACRAAAERGGELYEDILRFQRELFVAGAELATAPEAAGRLEDGVSRVTQAMVDRLEQAIDRYMDRVDLPPKFVIPGGTELSARLDVARSAVRRAERRVSALSHADELADETVLRYLNRVSDALFAMARFADEPEPELFEGRA